MIRVGLTALLLAALLVTGCEDKQQASMPAPYPLTADAMGRYCGMDVLEHAGPKGQVILEQIPEPIWFSSARDTIAFTMLPEEPKAIAAIYVSDMGKAPSWEKPGPENFIDARTAFYVIGSSLRGGMGVQEAVPFLIKDDADTFAAKNGGNVVGFDDMPQDYILGSDTEPSAKGSQQVPLDPNVKGHEHG
ncbi:nitrous oxide reductase accessory protein NosL [Pararhizobium antarcticum]|uniref:Copper resistance protein CopZ n=1 Tax=Pararhizobium antarcticum TaxID=1798805 RepID=A0A657LPJ6_9HYPH|nr:nitrous oxide reductase accessory protein NosL [Pararhizobium antarcticum]OJF92828.1 copper resistance protein CopZ [Pararhizobium antarcticum]OJF96152.1 copper resistance protein CopZ [Rhizobium sp. 58]